MANAFAKLNASDLMELDPMCLHPADLEAWVTAVSNLNDRSGGMLFDHYNPSDYYWACSHLTALEFGLD